MKVYLDYDRIGFKPLEEKMIDFFQEVRSGIQSELLQLNRNTEIEGGYIVLFVTHPTLKVELHDFDSVDEERMVHIISMVKPEEIFNRYIKASGYH